jgi:hypothetical protein
MEYDTIQDLRAFDQLVWDKVQEYLDDHDLYDAETVLGINCKTHELVLDLPSNFTSEFEQYQLATLIRLDENGNPEPDCDATYEVASQFFFVR